MRYVNRWNIPARAALLPVILIFGIMATPGLSQQYLNDQYKTVYALTNATIVVGDGTVIENGSILLQDGLISAIGTAVEIPDEAEVIDCTGMVLYPGFIDMHTNLGFVSRQPAARRQGAPQTQQTSQQNEPEPKNRKFDPNLRPDRFAVDLIDMNDENFKAARETGITAAVTVPDRGVFPGKASLIATWGDNPVDAAIQDGVFQFMQYRQERGGYPSTLFAVVSFQRQNLIDAKYYREREAEYRKNPRGELNSLKRRLTFDPVLRHLYPIITGSEPVVISALQENDIKRAVELAHFDDSFTIHYMLSGVTEGYRVVDLLKREDVPVIVSLNFPEPRRTTGYAFNLPIKPYEPPAAPGEKKKRNNRGKEEKSEIDKMVEAQIHGNAATLYNAGIKTVLSAGGNYKDFLKNLRLAVEAGLPADVALAKITREPAEMLGVGDIMGTLELGKLANLVVADTSIFAEKAKVKMVFVDGSKFEIVEPPKTGGAAGDISGKWDMTISVPGMGEQAGTMNLSVSGNRISGTIENEMGEMTIESGSLEGNKISLTVDVQGMQITFTGTVSEGSISGTAEVEGMGTIQWSAKRPGA